MINNILLAIGLIVAGIGIIAYTIKNRTEGDNAWGDVTKLIIVGIGCVIGGIIVLCKIV